MNWNQLSRSLILALGNAVWNSIYVSVGVLLRVRGWRVIQDV